MSDSCEWTVWALQQLPHAPSQDPEASHAVGDLALSDAQQRAGVRLFEILKVRRGALLADAVGTGKTRTSLHAYALWREHHGDEQAQALCCVPARLVDQWTAALEAAGLQQDMRVISHARMAAPDADDAIGQARFVLVDEAHAMRNPSTLRAQTLARWAIGRDTLLLTATPVCNSLWDLYHLLRVFVGDDDLCARHGVDLRTGFEMAKRGDLDIERLLHDYVVRARHTRAARPDVRLEQLRYKTPPQEQWMWRHLEATLRRCSWRAIATQWPAQLCVEHLMQRWESGACALGVSLDALVAYHAHLLQGAAQGRGLDRTQHKRHFTQRGAPDAPQYVLPFVWDALPDAPPEQEALAHIRQDLDTLRALRVRLEELEQTGCGRTQAVLSFLEREAHTKALIFTRFEDTAHDLFARLVRALGAHAQVGLVTGQGAWATGLGRSAAHEVIGRFAPVSQGREDTPAHQGLRVLIATDCLAQGVNLQDCGCVVMMDLPYSPLGVEQRIGRLVRPGGPHLHVRVLLPRPTDWQDSLGLRRRLEHKSHQAHLAGLGHELSASLFDPTHAGRLADRPLEAQDQLRWLRAQHARRAPSAHDGWWVTQGDRTLCFLALAMVQQGGNDQPVWLCVRPSHPDTVERRTGAILPVLVHAIDARAPIEPAPWPVHARASMERTLEAIVARHRALSGAPPHLEPGAPEWVLWSELTGRIQQTPGAMTRWAPHLRSLRARLLRSHPRGIQAHLTTWLEAHPDWTIQEAISMLTGILSGIPAPPRRAPSQASWRWIGGLWIRTTSGPQPGRGHIPG